MTFSQFIGQKSENTLVNFDLKNQLQVEFEILILNRPRIDSNHNKVIRTDFKDMIHKLINFTLIFTL